MTIQLETNTDRTKTAALLLAVANGEINGGNWLGHTGGAQEIDLLLLCGTTMERMKKSRKAVHEHLNHLRNEHKLSVTEVNGVFRLALNI